MFVTLGTGGVSMSEKLKYEELKPCPFCGEYPSKFMHDEITSSNNEFIYSRSNVTYSIKCLNEKCPEKPSIPEKPCEEGNSYPTLQDAIKAWNIYVEICEHNKKEFKPCPFCGCEVISIENDTGNSGLYLHYYCECKECEATSSSCKDIDDAINAWNRRAMSDNEKFLRKILQEICDIRENKISRKNQNNNPAYMMALIREDDIFETVRKFLQEAQS